MLDKPGGIQGKVELVDASVGGWQGVAARVPDGYGRKRSVTLLAARHVRASRPEEEKIVLLQIAHPPHRPPEPLLQPRYLR